MVITRSQRGKDTSDKFATQTANTLVPDNVERGDVPETGASHSKGRKSDFGAGNSRSSNTVRAQRLAAEANFLSKKVERERELARKQLERDREIAQLEEQAEQAQMRAELASLQSSRGSVCSGSRTQEWVENIRDPSPCQNPEIERETFSQFHRGQAGVCTIGDKTNTQSDIAQLAKAISSLASHQKPLDLPNFFGNPKDWLTFKSIYDRTKLNYSSSGNTQRLIQAVRGNARDAVESLFLEGEPERIIRALEQTFARPELLVAYEVAALRNFPKISTAELLNTFANKIRNCVARMKILNQPQYLHAPEILRAIISKLGEVTKSKFCDYAYERDPHIPKLELLSDFLLLEADKQLKFTYIPDFSIIGSQKHNVNIRKENIHATAGIKVNQQCTYCKGKHFIKSCDNFKSLSIDEKWNYVREKKLCYRCLKGERHTWNMCDAKKCGVDGCERRHHALLHGVPQNSCLTAPHTASKHMATNCTAIADDKLLVDIHSEKMSIDNQVATTSDCFTGATELTFQHSSCKVLLKVIPVTISGPTGELQTFALLDDGSTATLIDASVAFKLGIEEKTREKVCMHGVGGMMKTTEISLVDFQINGRDTPKFEIRNAKAVKSLNLTPQSIKKIEVSSYHHLHDIIDDITYEQGCPTVLIGARDWHLTIGTDIRMGKKTEPIATRTALGWVIYGSLPKGMQCTSINYVVSSDSSLDIILKEQYKLDSLGISKVSSGHNKNDQRVLNILETTSHRLPSGRYEVGLPWKHDNLLHSDIPDSYYHALSRLKSLEKRMSKDENFSIAYKDFIKGIISKGYAEECDPSTYHKDNELRACNGIVKWYLPSFGVYHPQKKKLRVVYDAAASTNGVCLNSLLLTGPDLLQSLLGIIFRFREGRVALTGDIREMFPQIKIREEDRDAQRFLWRDGDSSSPVKEFRMSSMIFGASSSPCTAIFIKNKNALEYKNQFPEAAHEIEFNHYMDDYIASHDNVDTAAQIAHDIVTVHQKCCFEMRAWMSNDVKALSLLPKELLANPIDEVSIASNDVSALGIKWNPCEDTLGFRSGNHIITSQTKITKREVLSQVMRVYDPLGLLAPIVIKGRLLIQQLWRESRDWDDILPEQHVHYFKDWLAELAVISHIKIPRWYLYSSVTAPIDIQLHMFADSSEQAYACVGYWRFTFKDTTVKLSLIASKARVAPLKPTTIPRLELQAALIACRFAETIKSNHRFQPTATVFWTDSMTVLRWLRSDARCFKPFVAHRVSEILDSTTSAEWRYVPSTLNIADDATRSRPVKEEKLLRWVTGPDFLLCPEMQWPKEPQRVPSEEITSPPELKGKVCHEMMRLLTSELLCLPVPDACRVSNWLVLIRATARVYQAVKLFRKSIRHTAKNSNSPSISNMRNSLDLLAIDLIEAEKKVLLRSQQESFACEISYLKAARPLPKDSRIASLAPVFDENGLLRINSRAKRVQNVTDSIKSPIILDGRHPAVQLLIRHYHEKAAHGFNDLVLNELRQKYWILRCRNTIKKLARECFKCQRLRARPNIPPIGDLPAERLEHHRRPYTNVGLDYFGPTLVTVGRRTEKRYVALYTCLVSRALHLEIVASLSTDSALMSLRRFIARRGCPSKILSDNGTAFVGASRELKALYGQPIRDFATNHQIEWIWIPPASPFMGGAWERMVRTVKNALKATLHDSKPKEELLNTLLLEVEAIVNSRPLTHIPMDPDSDAAITPFNFILGTTSVALPPVEVTDRDLIGRSGWKRVVRMTDHFWNRWVKEYLPLLAPRGKTRNGKATQYSEGDIVLIADSTLPRGSWPLGRITKLYRGNDSQVRVVDLATKAGILKRPVRKIVKIVPREAGNV